MFLELFTILVKNYLFIYVNDSVYIYIIITVHSFSQYVYIYIYYLMASHNVFSIELVAYFISLFHIF